MRETLPFMLHVLPDSFVSDNVKVGICNVGYSKLEVIFLFCSWLNSLKVSIEIIFYDHERIMLVCVLFCVYIECES